MRSPCTTAREQTLLTATRESPYTAMKTQHSQEQIFFFLSEKTQITALSYCIQKQNLPLLQNIPLMGVPLYPSWPCLSFSVLLWVHLHFLRQLQLSFSQASARCWVLWITFFFSFFFFLNLFCFFLILKSLILTCVPKHEPPSHLPPHNISLGHPMHQPQACCILRQTQTGDSILT